MKSIIGLQATLVNRAQSVSSGECNTTITINYTLLNITQQCILTPDSKHEGAIATAHCYSLATVAAAALQAENSPPTTKPLPICYLF